MHLIRVRDRIKKTGNIKDLFFMPCQKNASSLFLIYSLHDKISINNSAWCRLQVIIYLVNKPGKADLSYNFVLSALIMLL